MELDGLAERNDGKGDERGHQSDKRGEEEHESARLARDDLFLEEELQSVRYRLQKAVPAGSHGAEPDLHVADYLPFRVGRIGDGQQDEDEDHETLGDHGEIVNKR